VRLRLLRHATLALEYSGVRLLVDPMLSRARAMDPVRGAERGERIPLVELPVPEEELNEIVAAADAVLVSHLHRDHWDDRARELIRKDRPVFCQPPDAGAIAAAGFADVRAVDAQAEWKGLGITRTGGRHGTGTVGERMGPVSGFVLRAADEPTLYLAGDTVWCAEVESALAAHRPDVVVVHAGAAQFLEGGPITMDASDVIAVCRAAPAASIVAVHLEAVNHCLLTRRALGEALAAAGLAGRVVIPADGDTLELAAPPVLYEVSLQVEPALAVAVERYMLAAHIPAIFATRCFRRIRFDRADDGRFRTTYEAANEADLLRYLRDHSPRLRADFAAHFPTGASVTRETWRPAATWD